MLEPLLLLHQIEIWPKEVLWARSNFSHQLLFPLAPLQEVVILLSIALETGYEEFVLEAVTEEIVTSVRAKAVFLKRQKNRTKPPKLKNLIGLVLLIWNITLLEVCSVAGMVKV